MAKIIEETTQGEEGINSKVDDIIKHFLEQSKDEANLAEMNEMMKEMGEDEVKPRPAKGGKAAPTSASDVTAVDERQWSMKDVVTMVLYVAKTQYQKLYEKDIEPWKEAFEAARDKEQKDAQV